MNNVNFNNTVDSFNTLYMGTTIGEVLFGIITSSGNGRLKVLCDGQEFSTTTDTIKLAFKWDNIELKTFLNGTLLNQRTFTPINMQRITSGTITSPINIVDMWLAPTSLSDNDLIKLTTL